LNAINISESTLPEVIGGSWSLQENYEAFKSDRAKKEWDLQHRFIALHGKKAFELEEKSPEIVIPVGQTVLDISTRGLVELDHALHLISTDEKAVFLEAKALVPQLVENESHPLQVLQFEKYDAVAAAYRLVRYWARRKALFGDRAFLPLTQTGNGALTKDDIKVLNTGWIALLPNDEEGRPVICFDRSRLDVSMFKGPSRARNLFYILTVASQNSMAREEGGIYVGIFGKQSVEYDPDFFRFFADFIFDRAGSTLFRLKRIHIVCTGASLGMRRLFGTFLPKFRHILGKKTGRKMLVHTADSELGLIEELELYELNRRNLPSSIGGGWSYSSFSGWQVDMVAKENIANSNLLASLQQTGANNASLEQLELEAPRNAANSSEARTASRKCLSDLIDAIQLLPEEEKAAFMEASTTAPHLVEIESDATRFYQITDYNNWSAAHRIVYYWKKRKALFGDRAFLPMNQTGEGTLNRDDIAMLSSGGIIVLPRDSHGRSVVFIDSMRTSTL
jgi:hypothetical protein